VHVYRRGKLVVKWDLENEKAMQGGAPKKVLELLQQLQSEGLI